MVLVGYSDRDEDIDIDIDILIYSSIENRMKIRLYHLLCPAFSHPTCFPPVDSEASSSHQMNLMNENKQ